jgi:hypothetical protein
MSYGVIFPGNKFAGPYDTIDDILALSCFPPPRRMGNLADWQPMVPPEGYRVTKAICGTAPRVEVTGQIARRADG